MKTLQDVLTVWLHNKSKCQNFMQHLYREKNSGGVDNCSTENIQDDDVTVVHNETM